MSSAEDRTCISLWRTLFAASRQLEESVRRAVAPFHLGLSDFGVLELLAEDDSLPVSVLGRRLFLTSGSITTAIDRLAARDLVERHPSGKDARTTLVALSPRGRALVKAALRTHASAVAQGVSPLSSGEQRRAQRLLAKLVNPGSAKSS